MLHAYITTRAEGGGAGSEGGPEAQDVLVRPGATETNDEMDARDGGRKAAEGEEDDKEGHDSDGQEETAAAATLPLEQQRQAVFPWLSGTCLRCKELRIRCCRAFPCLR